jgi:MYXO-CTERM domain-containing protein
MRTLWLGLALVLLPLHAEARGVSARLAYDKANVGLNGGNGYKTGDNASGTLAWGESYVMMSHAAMFRATGDATYLVQLADHALNVLAHRDSVLGLKDYAGHSRPCWQSTKYSPASQPFCWVVHSGMLTYPMADLVGLVEANPTLKSRSVPAFGTTLGATAQDVLAAVEQTVATHAFEWRNGPASGEGYYLGDPDATFLDNVAGKALPLNQMNALGQTLAVLASVTKKSDYQTKLKGLCAYLRNRMTASGQTLVWTYWGDAWSQGKGEDISHAGINVELAHLCQAAGQSFTAQDLGKLAHTLFELVHVDVDTVADLVDGGGGTNTYKLEVGRWLSLSPFDARVWPIAANMFRGVSSVSGSGLLGLAAIAEHAPTLRDYSFYVADWQDLGDYRKATAYGANLLLLPPDHAQTYAFRVGYHAVKQTVVEQWDGSAYHPNLTLTATGTGFEWAFVPYDPKLFFAYSAGGALFQLTDSFVAGQGIEVKEVAPVIDPVIISSSLPPATVGVAYSAALQGTGDAPLLWSLVEGPEALLLDAQTGQIAWTAASSAPAVTVKVRLQNDSGEATRTLTIEVGGVASDGPAADARPPADRSFSGDASPAGEARATVGGGGCACAVSGGGGPGAIPAVLLIVAALGWVRRRGCWDGAARGGRARPRDRGAGPAGPARGRPRTS